jgi:hypothetical protein
MSSPVQEHLAELRRRLRGQPFLSRRIEEEISDHLAEAVEAARREGRSPMEAELEAVRRLGPVDRYLGQFSWALGPLRWLLFLGTTALGASSLWLVFVIAVVLPERDPGSRTLWTAVVSAFGLYGVVCLRWLAGGGRGALLPTAMLTLSVAAIAAGVLGLGAELSVAAHGGHFEGYLVLLGGLLIAQGLVAIAHTLLSLRVARRIRSH